MKKAVTLLTLSLCCFEPGVHFCSLLLQSFQKSQPLLLATSEMEKKLVGKWKFLYTDAGQEEIPPKDLTYILKADHTSTLEFTGEKNEKKQIAGYLRGCGGPDSIFQG